MRMSSALCHPLPALLGFSACGHGAGIVHSFWLSLSFTHMGLLPPPFLPLCLRTVPAGSLYAAFVWPHLSHLIVPTMLSLLLWLHCQCQQLEKLVRASWCQCPCITMPWVLSQDVHKDANSTASRAMRSHASPTPG